jgi:hypothetical protein
MPMRTPFISVSSQRVVAMSVGGGAVFTCTMRVCGEARRAAEAAGVTVAAKDEGGVAVSMIAAVARTSALVSLGAD